jgi:hypothetical protein
MTTVETNDIPPRLEPDYHPHWMKLPYLPYAQIGRNQLFMPDSARQKADPAYARLGCANNIALVGLEIYMLGKRLEHSLKEQDAVELVGAVAVACWSIARLQQRMAPQLEVYRDHEPGLSELDAVGIDPADASTRRLVAQKSFKEYGEALRLSAARLHGAYKDGDDARLNQEFIVMQLYYALLPELLTDEIGRLRRLVPTDVFPEAFNAAFSLLHEPANTEPARSEVSD